MASVHALIGRQHTLGHDVIDSDHMAIADWWLRAVNCEQIQCAFFIARLKKLMQDHFHHEAALIQGAGGRLCDCHRREHQMLLDVCDRAIARPAQLAKGANAAAKRAAGAHARAHHLYGPAGGPRHQYSW